MRIYQFYVLSAFFLFGFIGAMDKVEKRGSAGRILQMKSAANRRDLQKLAAAQAPRDMDGLEKPLTSPVLQRALSQGGLAAVKKPVSPQGLHKKS